MPERQFKNFIVPSDSDRIQIQARKDFYDVEGVDQLLDSKVLGRFLEDGIPLTSAPMFFKLLPALNAVGIELVIPGEEPYTLRRNSETIARGLVRSNFPFLDTNIEQGTEHCYEIEDQNKDVFSACVFTSLRMVVSNWAPIMDVGGSAYDPEDDVRVFSGLMWMGDEIKAQSGELFEFLDTEKDPYHSVHPALYSFLSSDPPEGSEGRIESLWGVNNSETTQPKEIRNRRLLTGNTEPSLSEGEDGDVYIQYENADSLLDRPISDDFESICE